MKLNLYPVDIRLGDGMNIHFIHLGSSTNWSYSLCLGATIKDPKHLAMMQPKPFINNGSYSLNKDEEYGKENIQF